MTGTDRDVAERYFATLESQGLRAIQFKSSIGLPKAFAGEADFDLVIDPEQFEAAIAVAEGLGFRRRANTDPLLDPRIIDLVCWDASSRRMHHLSFHRELIFGERPVKRHVIPWQRVVAVGTITHGPGLEVLRPEAELALLLVRVALRAFRPRRAWSVKASAFHGVEEGAAAEFHALNGQVPDAALRRATEALGLGSGDRAVRIRRELELQVPDRSVLEQERKLLLRSLRSLQVRSLLAARLRVLRHRRTEVTRSVSRGLVVAVVGADGAGKSSVTALLAQQLHYKLSSEVLYLGRPRDTRLQAFVDRLVPALLRVAPAKAAGPIGALLPLAVALGRRLQLRRAFRRRASGRIVITDRYPLREFHTMQAPMDGPRITDDGLCARLERTIYRGMRQDPDLLVVLVADDELVLARKTHAEDDEHIRAKAAAVRALDTRRPGRLALPADRPLEDIVHAIVTRVWEALTTSSSSSAMR